MNFKNYFFIIVLSGVCGTIFGMQTPRTTRQPKKNSQHVQEPQEQVHEQQKREQEQHKKDERQALVQEWLCNGKKIGPCW
jgi:cytoskeletal protein RodZ